MIHQKRNLAPFVMFYTKQFFNYVFLFVYYAVFGACLTYTLISIAEGHRRKGLEDCSVASALTDSTGNIHIVGIEDDNGKKYLQYATNASGEWTTKNICDRAVTRFVIALDANDTISVFYKERGNHKVKNATIMAGEVKSGDGDEEKSDNSM